MRPVHLLSDFGLDDHYAGMMHAVLMGEAPAAPRSDLTHAVPPGDVWAGCYFVRMAWPYLPEDAVVLAVVDPGVGTARRAVAVRRGERWLVAPDNGLAAAAGGADEAVMLDAGRMGILAPSVTFHGRDLFAPAAARLARGEAPEGLGPSLDPRSLIPSPLPEPGREGASIRGAVLHVDRFGNVVTNVPAGWVPAAARVTLGVRTLTRRVHTYGEATGDDPVLLEGSAGLLEVSVNGGSAAAALGVGRGDAVTIEPL